MISLAASALLLASIGAEAFVPTSLATNRLTRLRETADDQGVEEIAGEIPAAGKKYVVVGGGWGGWGAAKALCER